MLGDVYTDICCHLTNMTFLGEAKSDRRGRVCQFGNKDKNAVQVFTRLISSPPAFTFRFAQSWRLTISTLLTILIIAADLQYFDINILTVLLI